MWIRSKKIWLPWQRPLRDRKTNFRLVIYSHSSTNPENLAKIGLVVVEIIGLTRIVKNIDKQKQRQNISPPVAAASEQPGRLMKCLCLNSICILTLITVISCLLPTVL